MKKIILVYSIAMLCIACVRNEKVAPQNQLLDQTMIDDTLMQGMFTTQDVGHPTSGSVYLIQKKDGVKVLQFENLSTGVGPDVDILISSSELYQSNTAIKLDDLKYSGSFIVDLPSQIDVNTYHTVMIWCKEFNILFGTCKLKKP